MSIEQESLQNLSILESSFDGARAKEVLKFAKKNGFVDRKITCHDGSIHPASEYAVQLNCNADLVLTNMMQMSIKDAAILEKSITKFRESINIVSILLAMEESRISSWNPGSEMLYDIRHAGIFLPRVEVNAFLTPLGNSRRAIVARESMLYNNPLAIAIYCGRLLTLYGSLTGTFSAFASGDIPNELGAKYNACVKESFAGNIEALLTTFVPAYLGDGSERTLFSFITDWLRTKGYFTAPADVEGKLACESGLACYVTYLINRHLTLEKPQTEAAFGRIILVDVLCMLQKATIYKEDWAEKQVFCEDGTETDQEGHRYKTVRQIASYHIEEEMPFGSGRTSLHMANAFFGDLMPKEIAAAIDCYDYDQEENPSVGIHMAEYPLGLTLHIANTIVKYWDTPHIDDEG